MQAVLFVVVFKFEETSPYFMLEERMKILVEEFGITGRGGSRTSEGRR